MNIKDIIPSNSPLVLATPTEVDDLESRLWITFPEGYREYITKLGEGTLGGDLVRIYPPWRIEKELSEWRRRINKYWFWEKGRKVLPKERALECIIIGDTVNGDELIFHNTRPNQLFILPRDSENVFAAGNELLAAIEWMCSSGELVEPFSERNFEPFDSRKVSAETGAEKSKLVDPEGESLDELVELAKLWMKRHSARRMAQMDLKEHTGQDKKTALVHESLVVEGEYPVQPGYLIVYRIEDKASGLELGTFSWHKNEDSYGSQFMPNEANAVKLRKSS